ncbi:histidine phosphatase family protein [Mariprofundus ferrooxydans]|uniref:Alpha-ribazole-5`-phosphate phosphatase CobC, putative n=1 Tax=Mariprofundus ferrooxydans PV-1 TaxID=314345 RepID=Q0EX81_9PROT|nr:histidine phosphatase family protein [Mariprofundus ferrooxydans]EAU53909.1 alpha-ribazole-5`-phosphate phosphatase CobC, putative [Mariprofundus ferrooxydans PV-1]KON48324.1 cobalamin biosynthesis protein CobC [Mariprofundus ferrooxydans]
MLTVDLLRHGALAGGIKYRGQTDDPLTIQGRADMDAVWQKLAGDVDLIITSPLSRCAEPATAWAKQARIPCIIEPRIAEMHYGAWEGKTSEAISSAFPGMLEQWRRDPTGMRPPDGESVDELRQRVHAWLMEISTNYQDKQLLVVSHSGTLRMLIALALRAPIASTRHMDMPYACWSRLYCDEQSSRLAFHQRT